MTCTATTKPQGGCHATLAEIADHARGDAGDELPRGAALAVGVQRRHPQLSQWRRRWHHGGAHMGISAEGSSEILAPYRRGCFTCHGWAGQGAADNNDPGPTPPGPGDPKGIAIVND